MWQILGFAIHLVLPPEVAGTDLDILVEPGGQEVLSKVQVGRDELRKSSGLDVFFYFILCLLTLER